MLTLEIHALSSYIRWEKNYYLNRYDVRLVTSMESRRVRRWLCMSG